MTEITTQPRTRGLRARWRSAGRVRRTLIATGTLFAAFVMGVSALSAAWVAGYKIPLASGATYLRVQKLVHSGDAERSGAPNAPFFVLLVGNDSRPGVGGARGDALHLVGVNPRLRKATILDIPRDTCWAGDKINAANAQGGGPAQAAAVGGLIGVPISYVVDVDFAGFQGLVDGIGGVSVNVPTQMHDTYSGAYFSPGVQHMNGTQALSFSRDRHDFPTSDIVRTHNQGLLILDAMRQLRAKMQNAPGEFKLLALLGRHAQLDGVGMKDLYRLGRVAFSLNPDQIQNITIPYVGGQCLSLGAGASGLFADFRDDGIVEGTH